MEFTTGDNRPSADFSVADQTVTPNADINFTSSDIENVDSYSWDFGDGTTKTGQNVTHSYSTTGTYTVKLTVTNDFGEKTIVKENYIDVGEFPFVDFSADNRYPDPGGSVSFTNQTTSSVPYTVLWEYNGKTSTASAGIVEIFHTPGESTVKLTAYNKFGQASDTMIIRVSNTFKTVTIGTQTWMAENLKTTKYKDGTNIPHIVDSASWVDATAGGYCYQTVNGFSLVGYDYDAEVFYNYSAAQNVCPDGWHLPSKEEWETLRAYVASSGYSGKEGEALRSTEDWINFSGFSEGNGSDNYGFNGIPAGGRGQWTSSQYITAGWVAYWWSSTSVNADTAYSFSTIYFETTLNSNEDTKQAGASVRCIKD